MFIHEPRMSKTVMIELAKTRKSSDLLSAAIHAVNIPLHNLAGACLLYKGKALPQQEKKVEEIEIEKHSTITICLN